MLFPYYENISQRCLFDLNISSGRVYLAIENEKLSCFKQFYQRKKIFKLQLKQKQKKMYPEREQYTIKAYNKTFKECNLKLCFNDVLQIKKQFKRSKSTILKDKNISLIKILEKKGFNFDLLKQDKIFCVSQISPDIPFFMILRLLALNYPIEKFFIWNCEVPEDFFKFLVQRKWKINSIRFAVCHIGNRMVKQLKLLQYRDIQKVSIESDPFDNRGFKELLKLEMPKLNKLVFDSTLMTPDCLKIFQKRTVINMSEFGLSYFVNHHLVFKHIRDIVKLDLYEECIMFFLGLISYQVSFFFLNQLAKIDITEANNNKVRLVMGCLGKFDRMNSINVVKTLDSMIIYDYVTF